MYVVTLILVKIYFDVIFLSFFFQTLPVDIWEILEKPGVIWDFLVTRYKYTLYLIKRFFG